MFCHSPPPKQILPFMVGARYNSWATPNVRAVGAIWRRKATPLILCARLPHQGDAGRMVVPLCKAQPSASVMKGNLWQSILIAGRNTPLLVELVLITSLFRQGAENPEIKNMRKHPFATSSRSILCAAAILILTCGMVSTLIAQRAPKVLGHTTYRSPDRTLVATIVSQKQRYYGHEPSRVEIRTADGHLLASRDHSGDIDEGFTIKKAAWTADSWFFVYQVFNSGGHSPWHDPMFFYSRKRHRFYSLDKAIGGIITGDLELRPPCTVVTKGQDFGKSRKGLRVRALNVVERSVEIDLRLLEPRLSRSVEDY
jgi:hypothetical protein